MVLQDSENYKMKNDPQNYCSTGRLTQTCLETTGIRSAEA